MVSKNALSSVVTTSLLLIVAVVSVIGFQTFSQTYSSLVLNNIEQTTLEGNILEFYGFIDDILYLKSGTTQTLNILKIDDEYGVEMCSFDENSIYKILSLYYSFNDNSSTDLSNLKNNGTALNPLFNDNCIFGGCYNFNGIDDRIEISSPEFTEINKAPFTVSLWFKPNDLNKNQVLINLEIGSSQNLGGFQLRLNYNNTVAFGGKNSDSSINYLVNSKNEFILNEWNHIAGTFNGSCFTIYLNNLKNNMCTINEVLKQGTAISIGSAQWSLNPRHFNGSIDEVMIFNKTLSNIELENLYKSNDLILNLSSGINQIDLSSCKLEEGRKYNIVSFTDNQKLEQSFITK